MNKSIEISENSKTVLAKRYLREGETPEDLFRRVAKAVSKAEPTKKKRELMEKEFYELMTSMKFLPNSPTLMNAGFPNQQLSACFVLPVEDDMSKIFETLKHTAIIHKSGGGTGFNFSRLRPQGSTVQSTKGVSSGPISFMSVFDAATDSIKQGGMRRGANMGILHIDHPDILDFIYAKEDKTKLTNFNLSVAITDEFMEKVKSDTEKCYTDKKGNTYSAKDLFKKIATLAWKGGDPGVIFIDRMNEHNPTPYLGNYEATNPCWTGDTLVYTIEGPKSFYELAEIKEADVYCLDVETKQVHIRTMRNIRKTGVNQPIMRIKVDTKNGYEYYTLTPNHNLFIVDKNNNLTKIQAKDLKVGDYLDYKIVDIELDYGTADVYNGTVDEFHNYFVCNQQSKIESNVVVGFLSANCGEQPLLPYESCNLGSINLAKFVKNGQINYPELASTVLTATQFLDNVISVNNYPIKEIKENTLKTRKIGLGVMGFADMLVQLKIPYNSKQAIQVAKDVMSFIHKRAREMSEVLGKEKGMFPVFKQCSAYPRRNATVTTIAPTGTISIIAGASSGIEPYFALAYYRNVMDGTKLPEVNSYLLDVLNEYKLNTPEIINKIIEKGSLQNIEEIPQEIKDIFVTAHDISSDWHIQMQAAFQKHVDNAVSKTINLPHTATEKDVEDAYMLAYDLGCKGITVYRDGSRTNQVLNINKTEEKVSKDRPTVLTGKTIKVQTGCGKMYVTVNLNQNGKVFELFTNIGKAGGCATSQCEAIGRLASLSLKSGIEPEKLIKQLKGISCHMKIGFGKNQILSCSDAIGKALEQIIGTKLVETTTKINHSGACPECGYSLQNVEGCSVCNSCGYSKCS